MTELNFANMPKQQYEHRVITIKHSLLPTEKQESYSMLIKVVNDTMFGRIGLQKDPVFGYEEEMAMTGEPEWSAAKTMEESLILGLKNAVLERDQ